MSGASGSWDYNPDDPYQVQDDTAYGGSAYDSHWWDAIMQAATMGNPWALIFGNAANSVATGIDNATQSAMAQLVTASQQFAQAKQDLNRMQDEGILDTPLAVDFLALSAKTNTASDRLDAVANAASSAWGTAKSVFGLAGARAVVKRGQLGALAVPPLLAAGAILALVAFIGTIVSDVIRMRTNYDLIKQGLPPLPGGGFTADISTSIKWGAIAVLAVVALPPLLDRINKRG